MRREAEEAVKKLLEALSRVISIEEAFIFGSSVKGDWLKESDVDLIVVSRDFEGMPFTRRLDFVEEIQWKQRIKPHIEVFPYTPRELREKMEASAVIRDASRYWRRVQKVKPSE